MVKNTPLFILRNPKTGEYYDSEGTGTSYPSQAFQTRTSAEDARAALRKRLLAVEVEQTTYDKFTHVY